MIRITPRHLAATVLLAAAASVSGVAGEAPAAAAPPPYESKPYTMPTRGIPEPVRKAVQSADRPPEDTRRDGWRRPAEILALSQVRPGQRVLELAPFDLYYSRMLSNVLGPKGNLHMYEFPVVAEQSGEIARAFTAEHPNAKFEAIDFNAIEFPRNVDLVFSPHAYHLMLLTNTDMEAFHTKLFKAMKPGAIYLVIDHAATHGTGTDDTGRLRRIDPGVVRAGIQAQGFQLVEDSRLLENHDDDHKWPVFDKLDQTDQLVFKFRKPVVY